MTHLATLDSSTTYANNLALLRARWPRAADAVEAADPLSEECVVPSRSGTPTLRMRNKVGQWRWIHSRYDPTAEAEKQIAKFELEATDTLFMLGLGLGYPALAVIQNCYSTTCLIVLESDPAVLRAALAVAEFEEVLRHPTLTLLVGVDPDQLLPLLEPMISRIFSAGVKLFTHPALRQAFPDVYTKAVDGVQNFLKHGSVTVRSALYLSRISLRNRFENLPHYLESVDLASLQDRFRGYPGILVGAGPSLEKNVEALRQAEGRAVIVAVSTSLKALLGRNIRPDFTTVIDYHSISKRYFEGIPAEEAVPIICDNKANTASLSAYSGRKIFGNDLAMNSLLEGLVGDRGDLTGGATVAHTAFNILQAFGCDPIILVGMDLSYPGGRHHVGGTAIQEQGFAETSRFYTFEMKEWEWYLSHRKQLSKVPAAAGGDVWTGDVFLSYLREFEAMFADSDPTVIDSTEGGALKRGTTVMPLAAALEQFATRPIAAEFYDLGAPEADGTQRDQLFEKAIETLDRRLVEADELQRIYKKCLRLLETVVETTRGGSPADSEVIKVIGLKKDLARFDFFYFLLNNLAQADLRERIQRDLGIHGERVSGVDRQRRQAERDLEYVKGLRRALEFVVDQIRAGKARLRSASAL